MRRTAILGAVVVLVTAACSPTPSSSPAPAEPCPIVELSGAMSSDRLVGIRIESDPGGDRVTFVLGERSSAPTQPSGRLRAASPPFSAGGSGLPVEVPGARHVEIRLEGMFLYDDAGVPSYDGPRRFDRDGPILRALANVDEFEGHTTWIAGFDGPGCVTLESGPAPGVFVVGFGT